MHNFLIFKYVLRKTSLEKKFFVAPCLVTSLPVRVSDIMELEAQIKERERYRGRWGQKINGFNYRNR